MANPNPIGFDEWQPDKSDRANPTAEAKGVYSVAGQYAPFPDIQTYGPPSDVDSYTKVLLHMDGPDASTTFNDAAANHVWTRTGTAQVDTADSKFGGASLLCVTPGDYISTPNNADYALGAGDFTVDCWFKCNVAHDALSHKGMFGKATGFTGASDRGWFCYRNQTTDTIEMELSNGTTNIGAIARTVFTSTVNTGWHHLALVRTGSTLLLYIDGLLETTSVLAGTINEPSVLGVGCIGAGLVAGWVGWIDEFRVSVGINRYAGVDNPDNNTNVLLHMNGALFATQFPDHGIYGLPFTANGNAQVDTAQFKFGGASALFDGTGDYLTTPDNAVLTLSSAPFTIECWFRCNATGGSFAILAGQGDNTGSSAGRAWMIYRTSANVLSFDVWIGGAQVSTQGRTQFTNLINTGWHHIACVRSGNTFRLYIDGLLEASNTVAGAVQDSAAVLGIATAGEFGGGSAFNPLWTGWIDEFRLSVGVDRYSATADLPDSFTRLLLHMNGADGSTLFPDHAPPGHAWTAAGTAQVDTAQSKFGGASALFNGSASSDCIFTGDSGFLTLGSSDFTIECWFRCNTGTGIFPGLCGQGNNGGMVAATSSVRIYRDNNGHMNFLVSDGSSLSAIFGGRVFTDTVNTGWHHIAVIRTGNIMRMFIDGVQDGSDLAFSASVQDSASQFEVGRASQSGTEWVGWIDEFRLSVGVARWTAPFTPPTAAYNPGFTVPTAPFYQGFSASLRTTAYSYGGGAANVVLGADTFYDNDTAPHIFFGDANRLYRLESRQAVDLSKPGFYAVGDSDTWQFCQFGNNVIGVSANVDPQHYIMGTSTDFGNLAGSPPHGATSVARVSEFVWLGKDFTVYWSAFGDCTDWVPDPVTQAGNQELDQERGEIMCLIGLDYAAIFQERAIRRAIYVGPPVIWDFGQDYVEKARGAVARNAAVAWGRIIFYASDDGFYAFDGQSSTPIGYGKVDNYFTSNLNYAFRHKISCGIDYARKIVVWGFPTGSAQLISELLIYSIQDGRWTHDVLPLEFLFDTPAEPFTVDNFNLLFPANNLDGAVAPNDIDSASFDDRRIRLAGFQVNSHALGLFTGAPRAATIDTKEFEAMPGKRALLTEVWPLGDYQQGAISASIGHRHALPGAAIDFTNPTQMNRAGYCPQRIDARFLRVRQQITAGATWRRAEGVHYTATPTGSR